MCRGLRNHLSNKETKISRARIVPRLSPLVIIANDKWFFLCPPSFQDHAHGAVFAEFGDFLFF
jgi:hypothetical protein